MRKKVLLIILVLFIGTNLPTQAQSGGSQTQRLELKVKKDWKNFTTISCGNNGIISYYFDYKGSSLFGKMINKMHVTLYDNKLKKSWTQKVKIAPNKSCLSYLDHYYDEKKEKLYILFGEPGGSDVVGKAGKIEGIRGPQKLDYGKKNLIKIVTINPESQSSGSEKLISQREYEINVPGTNFYNNFVVANNRAYMFLDKRKTAFFNYILDIDIWVAALQNIPEKYIYSFNLNRDDDCQTIGLDHKGKYYTHLSVFKNDQNDIFYLANIHKAPGSEYNQKRYYLIDGKSGKLKQNINLNKDIKTRLQLPTLIQHKNNQLIFASLFGEEEKDSQSGLLFSYYKNSNLKDKNAYSLEDIFGYDTRYKRGIFNKQFKNRTYLKFHRQTYKLDDKGSYLIIGEKLAPAYNVTYRSNNADTREFVGWAYQSAYLMAYDDNHKLEWTKKFDMKSTLVRKKDFKSRLYINRDSSNNIMLMFGAGNNITTLTIEDGEAGEQKFFSLETKTESSEEEIAHLQHWYNEYYLVSGFINRNEGFLNSDERLYYIAKIKFHE